MIGLSLPSFAFMEQMPWVTQNHKILGDETFLALRQGLIERISLANSCTSDTYTGFEVTILNPMQGKVAYKRFAFADYLPEMPRVAIQRTRPACDGHRELYWHNSDSVRGPYGPVDQDRLDLSLLVGDMAKFTHLFN